MIITVGSNKGGTGKTTTATNIAIALASKEKDVCLIDADFQRSSSKWYQDRQESRIFPTITLVEKYDNISNTIEELNKKFDYVYIDLTNDRFLIRDILKKVAPLIKENGIVGLNDYLIYDGIIEDDVYGTFQSTNEFLKNNIKIKETTDILIEKFLNDYNIFLNEFLKYNNGIAIKFEYLTENTENCFNDLLNKINLNNNRSLTYDD